MYLYIGSYLIPALSRPANLERLQSLARLTSSDLTRLGSLITIPCIKLTATTLPPVIKKAGPHIWCLAIWMTLRMVPRVNPHEQDTNKCMRSEFGKDTAQIYSKYNRDLLQIY